MCMKERKAGKVYNAMIGEGRGRYKSPRVSNFIKMGFCVDLCSKVGDYVKIMLKFDTKQYSVCVLSRTKFERNRWQWGLYRCSANFHIWSDLGFSVFLSPVSRPNV